MVRVLRSVKATRRFVCILLLIVLANRVVHATSKEPFGVVTFPAEQSHFTKEWRDVRNVWAVERKLLDRCLVDRERCPSRAALKMLTIIDEARIQIGRARLGYVNRAINLAIRPLDDRRNYGVREVWTSPLFTLSEGKGDCTDYAIAKYYALGALGIPASERRLVIVGVKSKPGMLHTVLGVREVGRWWILDNLRMAMMNAADDTGYVPLFAFDNRGVRQYANAILP